MTVFEAECFAPWLRHRCLRGSYRVIAGGERGCELIYVGVACMSGILCETAMIVLRTMGCATRRIEVESV